MKICFITQQKLIVYFLFRQHKFNIDLKMFFFILHFLSCYTWTIHTLKYHYSIFMINYMIMTTIEIVRSFSSTIMIDYLNGLPDLTEMWTGALHFP